MLEMTGNYTDTDDNCHFHLYNWSWFNIAKTFLHPVIVQRLGYHMILVESGSVVCYAPTFNALFSVMPFQLQISDGQTYS